MTDTPPDPLAELVAWHRELAEAHYRVMGAYSDFGRKHAKSADAIMALQRQIAEADAVIEELLQAKPSETPDYDKWLDEAIARHESRAALQAKPSKTPDYRPITARGLLRGCARHESRAALTPPRTEGDDA